MPEPRETVVAFESARAEDAEALVALRLAAMRESLERIGRFDPVRARERFLGGFAPEHTRHIVVAGRRVGFLVVKPAETGLLLDHLYIAPEFQRRGIGAAVLATVFEQADAKAQPLHVGALRGSDSNRFYQRNGFELVEAAEWDNYYVRACRTSPAPVIALEPQVAAHAGEMFAVLSDPAIYEHENEPPESLEWLRQRFARLESRRSPDGRQQWLNWVIRLPACGLIGYVQATVHADGRAAIAYVLGSRFWGRGLARQAVEAMIAELEGHHEVRTLSAVLKRGNTRSLRLLERLGFTLAPATMHETLEAEADEMLMVRDLRVHQTILQPGEDMLSNLSPSIARGACLCGGVSFKAGLPSNWVAHCHCTRCQRAHGSAFVTWVSVGAAQVELDDPAQLLRWYEAAEGGSRGFCSKCGSPMFFKAPAWPGELHIARALFTDPIDREPQVHGYHDTHVDWVTLGDDLPRKPAPA